MNIDTLKKKITIIKDGINEIIDFATPTFIPDFLSDNFVVTNVIVVSEQYDRRPDLISLAMYGSDAYMDIILKCNGISDPLQVRTGMAIGIPLKDKAQKFYINPVNEIKESKQTFIDPKKKTKVDTERLKTLAKISASIKNGSKQNLPTNQLKADESNITINKESNSFNV